MKTLFLLPLFIGSIAFGQVTDTGDKVGIGTTSPTSKLHVNGTIGIGIMDGSNTEGFRIDYVDGGSGTTTFKNNRWGGDIYFKRNSSLGERTQFSFGGASEHYMNIYNANNEVKVRFNSGSNSYINGGNLGIGTTNPSEKLHIENGVVKVRSNNNSNRFIWSRTDNTMLAGLAGDGARKLFFLADNSTRMTVDGLTGNVGIGITTPSSKLHIKGDGSTNQILNVFNPSTSNGAAIRLSDAQWNSVIKTTPNSGGVSENLDFIVGSTLGMRINELGRVGIGTTDTQGFKLGVNGKIAAEEVKVATYANWSDFVFNHDYNLATLKEVEQHIKDKGHLKDIPSAEEVKKDGFYLAEMNAKLLQKIEELTLYTIEQEKELQNQKIINESFEKELKTLEDETQVLKSLFERVKKLEENIKL